MLVIIIIITCRPISVEHIILLELISLAEVEVDLLCITRHLNVLTYVSSSYNVHAEYVTLIAKFN